MKIWIVIDSITDEPVIHKTKVAAMIDALKVIRSYGKGYGFDAEEIADAARELGETAMLDKSYFYGYLGELYVRAYEREV